MESKADLRERIKAARNAIPLAPRAAWSDAIRRRVLELPEVIAADSIFCYVSIGSEVDTRQLLRDLLAMDHQVAVPILTDDGQMQAHLIASLDELVPGRFGIPAPTTSATVLPAVDVALTPGLAFTRQGDRLGYGAGHYDRFFAAHPTGRRIGLAFASQLVGDLPREPHDVRMSAVATEDGWV